MSRLALFARLAVWLILCVGLHVPPAAAAKPFPAEQFSYYLSDYDRVLAGLAKTVTRSEAELEADIAAAEQVGNARLAAASIEQLLTRRPTDGALWLKLGRLLAIATPINESDGYELPWKTAAAGLRAYLMARGAEDEAQGLAAAAQGFAKRQNWRPALQALKESLRLVENVEARATYETMRLEHGFRIVDYKVETDATPPRVCFELSDPPSRAVSDFSAYFRLEPGPAAAVTAEATRLCLEGLKHGERYSVTARKGLPSAFDDEFAKDFDYEFYVRDRSASVRFVGRSYVLPRTGQSGIPLISVNSREAKLALYRIGDRNLIGSVLGSDFRAQISGYSADEIEQRYGAKVWEGRLETPAPLNEDVTTAMPLDEAAGKLAPGLYVVTAEPAAVEFDSYNAIATQWFVVSDLGLSTLIGKDGLHVAIRSIASAEVLAQVDVRLIARNNEILASGKTGDDGTIRFAPGLIKGEGGSAPALVVAESAEGDYSFVDLTQPSFDLSDRGVAGRAPPSAVDAFVYAERGVYRRGETVHVAILLRDEAAKAMAELPVVAVVERPDGVEYSRTTLADQGQGGRSLDIAIDAVAQSGTWRVKALVDPQGAAVGDTTFLVEDYVPDRLEFDLAAKSSRMTMGGGANFAVDGRYLFGAPAAGLDLEATLSVTADPAPFPDWKGYRFGLMDERFDAIQTVASGLPQTDIGGHADLALYLPDLPVTTRPLRAEAFVRLREPGGRAVERTASLPVEASRPLIGIKDAFDEGAVGEGQPAEFNIVAIDPQGKAVAAPSANWTLKRLTTDYQWFSSDGYWRYEAITRSAKIGGGQARIAADLPLAVSHSLSWGEYRLEFAAEGFTPASVDFSVGYYYADSAKADTPDALKIALDRAEAKPGETIAVNIGARYAGKASIKVVGDRLLSERNVDVPEGGSTVAVTVGDDWGTGAYVLATLYRPMDVEAKRMPARAVGLAWFAIDRAQRTLDVKLDAPETMKPRQGLNVPVKVGNLAPGEEAYITVAAVDVGILNLTRYNPPAPEKHYLDQKRLSAELRDLYGVLIDGMQGERGRLRSGGDAGAALNAPPPTQPPLSLFSGIVKVAADGTASVAFDIPAFNGTVRLMAVAWSAGKVGHASADVIVRDPMVVAGTLPRFLAVGDTSRLRFDLVNAEAPAGDYTLGLSIDGPLAPQAANLIRKVTIGPPGSRASISVPIIATGVGNARIVATLKGPGDLLLDQVYSLGVLPSQPPLTRRTTMELAADGGAITLSSDLLAEMQAGTASVAVSVGPLPEIDVAGLVRDLDRYPYGCSEQTVSGALPLLYLSEIGVDPRMLDGGLQERLQKAVTRLVNRQSGSGAFGLWSSYGDDTNLWLSAFVTDFLLRAREQNFAVPEEALVSAIDYLRNTIGNAPDIEAGGGADTAYALYVLARAGRAPAGDLKYLADTRIGDFGSPLAKAQVGAALAMLGDGERADTAFASAIDSLLEAARLNDRSYRADYGSVLRDASAILALATDSRASPRVIKAAMTTLAEERAESSYASTQEMSWMVLAARAIAEEAKALRLEVDGTPVDGAFNALLRQEEVERGLRIANTGAAPLRAVVAVTGSPKVAEPAAANGLTISRSYYTLVGEPVDVTKVAQNTRLVAVLAVQTPDASQESGNFLLVDPLPSGFEIENPALVASGATAALAWLGETTWASHTEFRDDRFVAAFTTSTAKLAYMIRAVLPGTYVHPGASVEDMYRPEKNARTAAATVEVTEP